MLEHEVSKELVLGYADVLKKRFSFNNEADQALIKKGLNLYRQGSVYNVQFSNELVRGRVQDVIPVDVTLNLEDFEGSTCSCPSTEFCRHQMAVFFSIYASVARIGALLDEWKEEIIPTSPLAIPSLMKARDLHKPYEELSLISWQAFFKREYESFLEQYSERDRHFFSSLYYSFFQKVSAKGPKVKETNRLFAIHTGIFTINKMLEVMDKQNLQPFQFDTWVSPHFHNVMDDVVDEIFHLRAISLPFSLDTILHESMDAVRETLLREGHYLFYRFSIYRALWSVLFNRKKWIEEEEELLVTTDSDDHDGNLLALVHLAFLQRRDQEAINYLSRLDSTYVSYSFWWIHVLSNNHDWKRVSHWVKYAARYIDSYVQTLGSFEACRHFTRTFLKEVSDYCEANDPDLYIEMMKKLLPYSYVEFDHHLLHMNDYRAWVDLQILVGYSAGDCDRQTLKKIEDNEREALLPFYHQAVMDALEQKNRASYKQAVKYLRKLRASYRKINQLDVWEMYIERLALNHKRLRAFQQELARANMIPQQV
ncbi:SWIM zinc finger family protein [Bacillus sp. PS06]|uniref:SWIM zinc finger family protein n=1 Tax=Bacillus sp. PS06 TaxID=2764176 RepID=UPI00177B480A|nr:SWIM zinc finger family protein [Bacillus sp. PS06]MBD8069446.1 SWIM zinc finger family protein [Bacillus sp. PS06]